LTAEEQKLLDTCEKEIEDGMQGFYAVGKHLHIIKTKKLYRAKYKTVLGVLETEANGAREAAGVQADVRSFDS
jgi:hypothetical protein